MRKLLFLLALTVAVALVAPARAQTPPPDGASGGPTYSPVCCGLARAFDGDTGTYWQGAYNDTPGTSEPYTVTAWHLAYGFGVERSVTSARVLYYHPSFVATAAHVDCSTDGIAWTILAPVPEQADSTIALSGVCRWVRLTMGRPANGTYSVAVREFAVASTAYSGPTTAPTMTPLATSTPTLTTASAVYPAIGPIYPPSIAVLGDSVTETRLPAEPSWASLLAVWRDIPIHNLGVSGLRSAGMLARMPDVLATGAPYIVIVATGNDLAETTPMAVWIDHYRQMVQQARAAGREVMLVANPPRATFSAESQRALRDALRDFAVSNGVRYLDPWPLFEDPTQPARPLPTYVYDGTHPNDRGSFVLARAVAHALGWGFPGD